MKNVVIIRNAAAEDFGGGERFPVFLATVLRDQGYTPTILSRSDKLRYFADHNKVISYRSWWWSHQNWNGKNALLVPIYVVWQIILYFHYLIWFLRLHPKVVHIQSKDDFIAASWAAKTVHSKIIWTDHADLKHVFNNVSKPYRNPTGKLVASAAKYVDSITVVSKSELGLVKQHLAAYPNIIKKLQVIYNGAFDTAGNKVSKRDNKICTFLYVGRVVRDKGIVEMINAFNTLYEKNKNTQLVIVGDGPDRKEFEKLTINNSIHFMGHQDDPRKYLSTTDIFVYPTYHEGFSLSLVEAAMMSLPIITTNVGGNPEIIINNKTGLLVSSKNTDDLYLAMEKLFKDPSLRKRLSESARSSFEKSFRFDKIVINQFIPIYEKDN